MPILWHAPQPFCPSIMAIGCQWIVGIAFIAAHAAACLPLLYSLTLFSWHAPQVSGVGIFTFAVSRFEIWSLPWQTEQSTPFLLCLLNSQSRTTFGVTSL